MEIITKIGNSNYKTKIKVKGGAVYVFKNDQFQFQGQWVPGTGLALFDCPFEKIREKIESEILKSEEIKNIVFPYFG